MGNEWYYIKNDAQNGPVTFDDLRVMAQNALLERGDRVWHEGMTDWVLASQVMELFPANTAGPPPLSTQSKACPPPMPTPAKVPTDDPTARKPRLVLAVAAAVTSICFFLPQFILSAPGESEIAMGWDSWFGILLFILGLLALMAAVADVTPLVNLHETIRSNLRYVHGGLGGLLLLFGLLGLTLGLCSIGFGASSYLRKHMASVPAGFIPLVLSAAVHAGIAAMLLVKKR